MSATYERIIRPLLFRTDAELAHRASVVLCDALGRVALVRRAAARCFGLAAERLRVNVAGIDFANPLGLAAGYDKNGHTVGMMGALGFGHVEIGSVSAYRSLGNAKPRLFRLPADRALVVHYGLPNDGVEAVAKRLRCRRRSIPIGLNLVKTNDPSRPNTDEETIADYVRSARLLNGCADYLCLNLSCPNTEHGRSFFDDMDQVDGLLRELARIDRP